ncbi:MAG: ABC transporter permease [Planctomycetota bacterium]
MCAFEQTFGKAKLLPRALLADNEVFIAATDPIHPFLPETLIAELAEDQRVSRIQFAHRVAAFDLPSDELGNLDRDAFYNGPLGGWIPGKRVDLVAWQSDEARRGTLLQGRWPTDDSAVVEIVIPQHLMWSMTVGDYRRLECDTGVFTAQVVGISRHDDAFLGTAEALWLSPWHITKGAAEKLAGSEMPPSECRITLDNKSDQLAFAQQWRSSLSQSPEHIELWDQQHIERQARSSSEIQLMRSSAVTLIGLTIGCSICIALAVQGNAARQRIAQMRMLRCIGASPATLASTVILESIALAAAGIAGVLLISWPLFSVATAMGRSVTMTWWSIAITSLVLLAGTLLGGSLPSYRLLSIQPLNPSNAQHHQAKLRQRYANRLIAIGLLILVFAVSLWLTATGSIGRVMVLTWFGIPMLTVVTILVTPLIIEVVGWILVPFVAVVLNTNATILTDQIKLDRSASVGAVLAMSVGLSGFVWTLCWGASMLEPFVVDPNVPRWMISIYPFGLDQTETKRVLEQPELKGMEPLVLVDTRLARMTRANEINSSSASWTSCLVMGLRPEFAKDQLPIEVVQGDPETMFQQLSTGTHGFVSSWYAASANLNAGDQIEVAIPGQRSTHSMTIAAVVKFRGWLMCTKQNKTRLNGKAHQLLIISDVESVRRTFNTAHANYLWGDGASGDASSDSGAMGSTMFGAAYPENASLRIGTESSRHDRERLAGVVKQTVDVNRPISHAPDGITVTCRQRSVQVDDIDRVRSALRGDWGGVVVRRLGWMPLIFLAASLFSVVGTLTGSLRSRARELAILRSCGLSRFGLLRLGLGESVLHGVSALVVSCLLGFGGAWLMLQVAHIAGIYWRWAGIGAELLVPWNWLWPGMLLTFLICGLASSVAAYRIGKETPAQLLRMHTEHK